MKLAVRRCVQIAALFAVLFGIAWCTRWAARTVPIAFGMHAVLCAPLFAGVAAAFARRTGCLWPVHVAGMGLAAVLGSMSPVMGMGIGLPSAVGLAALGIRASTAVANAAEGRAGASPTNQRWALALGSLFGGLLYPATLFGGVALGSVSMTGSSALTAALLVVLGCALAVGGAQLGALVKATASRTEDGCQGQRPGEGA